MPIDPQGSEPKSEAWAARAAPGRLPTADVIARRHGWYRRDIESDDLDDVRTDAQKEWARWAASGYAKRWQPRSMLWLGGIFVTLLIAGLFTVIWLSAHGRL